MALKGSSASAVRDVAILANVALSSVSRVLNGHPSVSEELRSRVLRAVAELDYQPDFTAANLRRGSTMTIAFLVRDIASPLFSEMVKAVEATVEEFGYSVLLMNSGSNPLREAAHIRSLARTRVDGVVISLSNETDRDCMAALKALRAPVVMIDRAISDIKSSSVLSDHFSGLSAATRHLAAQGHRRIALITGSKDVLASRERLRGYKSGLRSAGLRSDPALVRMETYDEIFGEQQAASVLALDDPPTAIISGGAMIGYGVLRSLRHANKISQVAMVACDSWRSPELFEPSVSVVRRDVAEIGRVAAELLLEAINVGTYRSVTLPTEMVPGTPVRP